MRLFSCGYNFSLIVTNIPDIGERIVLTSGQLGNGVLGIGSNTFQPVHNLEHIKQVSCSNSTAKTFQMNMST